MFSLLAALIAVTVFLCVLMGLRADLTRSRSGKILAFLVLFLMPCLVTWAGFSMQMERAKSTEFCLSCHIMADFGRSLYVDDKSYLPAAHFQNHRIPRGEACYTCHTNYTMFGGLHSKWRGLRHVYVEYLGTIPKPENIKLYEPFNNRECLYCHAGARSFLESSSHHKNPELLALAGSNKLSCMSSGCHDIVHDVATLKDANFWKEPASAGHRH
jgi:cytochrome c-type protein NapC